MLFSWIGYTILIFAIIYLLVNLNYTKSLLEKEKKFNAKQKEAIKEEQLLDQ